MIFRKILLISWGLIAFYQIAAQDQQTIYQKDFEQYWNIVNESFAYFDTQKTDWQKVKEIYQKEVDAVQSKNEFIQVLEKCNLELYNGHVGLNTNLPSSSKLIPSQTDVWVKKVDDKYLIKSLRAGYNAEAVGLKVGMEIIKFNDQPIHEAVQKFLPKSFSDYDDRVFEFSVNTLLAGTHDKERKFTVLIDGMEMTYLPDRLEDKFKSSPPRLLDKMIFENNFGYIKINNSLWNQKLIKEFDVAMEEMIEVETKGLILDLRETPSGGNNTVGKAILGRFTDNEFSYQRYRYVYDEKDSDVEHVWTELVMPREKIYLRPVIILAGYWTGSMGEAITIGFDAMEHTTLTIGTPLADLLGAVWSYNLDETGIGFQIPGIKLYHANGTPREDFVPNVRVEKNDDILEKAIEILLTF